MKLIILLKLFAHDTFYGLLIYFHFIRSNIETTKVFYYIALNKFDNFFSI